MADEKKLEKGEKGDAYRQCLYKGDDYYIFVGGAAIAKALKGGWKDHPDKAATAAKSE